MNFKRTILVACIFLQSASLFAACSSSDLQRCLDSACTEQSQPASRCYLCGTSAAPRSSLTVPKMQSLGLGRSAAKTITEKELKDAPNDPGERYQWASQLCIKKLGECTAEDISDLYDKLIEQSCKVALGESEYAASMKKTTEKKTMPSCEAEINGCLLDASKCNRDMSNCESDDELDRNFSACAVQAVGCDEFVSPLRAKLTASRDSIVAKKSSRIQDLVALRRMEREEKLASAKNLCTPEGSAQCVLSMCGNMPNGLKDGQCASSNEKSWAASLCKFVDVACNKIK